MKEANENLSLASNALDNHDIPLAKIYIHIAKGYLERLKV